MNVHNIDNFDNSEMTLYIDICDIIDGAKIKMANYVNTNICMSYWRVGTRIKEDILFNKRAEYGKQVIKTLSTRLNQKYGKGWGFRTLQHCERAAYTFSEDEIRYATSKQL